MVAMELTRHPHPLVATQAVEALAKHPSTEVRLRLRELCRSPDNGLRLAALTAMADAPTADDLDAIEGAFRSSTGDVAAEVRFNAVRAAGKIGGPRALALVREAELLGLAEQPFLAQVAREELARVWSEKPTSVPTAAPTANPEQLPYAGDGISTWTKNPLARMRTDRGELVIELFPRDAPLHVHNFIELAQRKAYDGLTIHRVVPDFVVQGGDYRGDGNGGESARGGALRHEVNRRKFARGALGMPRNDDWDSGGSQFFLTHRPTPHLDGRYTLFGQLVSGEETLDRLEVGDRIRSLRIEY